MADESFRLDPKVAAINGAAHPMIHLGCIDGRSRHPR
ncbi:hypothetical protein QOZ99_003023 [Angulomicrobium amanitiforme]|uniref:Uncharacterized protein n=1 Tax=Ancylobacter amanitiformis TaxID=217069 RepID=A0ABU0LTT7_9HYPH|nr:hypothetical protein [Ancylobacter amanitiformis]